MSSVADIANMALGHIGVSSEIQNLESESSAEARACRRFYEPTRDEVLRDFAWPFATVIASLTLHEEDPTTEWQYSYAMPADVWAVRRLHNGTYSRAELTTNRVKYVRRGQYLYTDQQDAVVEYTQKITDTEQFPPDFVAMLAYLLASRIAPSFGAEAVKLGDRALKLYEWSRAKAQMNALNEESRDFDGPSEYELSRG